MGLTVGAGAAYAIDNHWSIGAEYRYSNYGSQTFKLGTIRSDSADPDVARGRPGDRPAQISRPTRSWRSSTTDLIPSRHHLSDKRWQSFASATPYSGGPRFYGGVEYLLWDVKGAPLSVPLVSHWSNSPQHTMDLLVRRLQTVRMQRFCTAPRMSRHKGGNDTQDFSLFSGARVDRRLLAGRRPPICRRGEWFRAANALCRFRSTQRSDAAIRSWDFRFTTMFPTRSVQTDHLCRRRQPADLSAGRSSSRTSGWAYRGRLERYQQAEALGRRRFWRGQHISRPLVGAVWDGGLPSPQSERGTLPHRRYPGLSGPYTGQSGVVWDQFQTKNRFYGALLGMRNKFLWGPWSLDLATSVALGASKQTISISGGYTSVNFGPTSGQEGVFAQPANEGTYSSTRFAFVPEVQAKVGYNITPAITLTVGYNFIYYSNVVRPGDQINREVPKGQTFQQAMAPSSLTSPARLYNTTDFYAQGLSVGGSARF